MHITNTFRALSAGFVPLALTQGTAQQTTTTITYTVEYATPHVPTWSPVSSTPQPTSTPIPSSSSFIHWTSSSASMATIETQSVATPSPTPSSTFPIIQTANAPAVALPGALAAGIIAVAGVAML